MGGTVVVGTRGSPLAIAQTNLVIDQLRKATDGVQFEVKHIRTSGDRLHDVGATALLGKRMFTKEIEEALISGTIDVAIHSTKDLQNQLPDGLTIGAVPQREDPRDVLVTRTGVPFKDLPLKSNLGTSSLRRRAQILSARPDLTIVGLRGNVDTRLRKLKEGAFDGIVLAAAGMVRLGFKEAITEFLSPDIVLPAVGQGALALQIRRDDNVTREIVSRIEDEESRLTITAERAFSQHIGGDCRIPIAAYGVVNGDSLELMGMVASFDGKAVIRERVIGERNRPETVGNQLAEKVVAKGGGKFVEEAKWAIQA